MADINPNIPGAPAGAVPPVKKETGKVQPKKETVRINLPPKPSTAPTIKLPTLPPGGPTGAPSAAPFSASVAKTPPHTGAGAPRAAAPVATAAPAAQARPTPAVQRAAPVAAPAIGALDKILVMAAAVAGLIAVVTSIIILVMLTHAITA